MWLMNCAQIGPVGAYKYSYVQKIKKKMNADIQKKPKL